MKNFQRSLTVFVTLLLAACGAPSIFVLHAPMQPSNSQNVTYTASSSDSDGVASIEIWEDRNTLGTCNNGMQCATRVSTTLLKTCSFAPAQNNAVCSFTTASPYADGSFIGYQATAKNTGGASSTEGWIYYAAGAFPWPDNPIPIYGTGEPAKRLDVVFIPDTDYGGNNTQFVTDVTGLVTNGYFSTQNFARQVRPWRGYWNLYVTYQTGDAKGYLTGGNQAPSNWTNLRTIVNAGAIVHTAALRDAAGIGDGSLLSITAGDNQTLVHESGHAVFSLADEYCCDGGYWNIGPHANVFDSQAACQADATANGYPTADCTRINPGAAAVWWHADAAGDLMAGGDTFGRSDQARVNWMYFDNCADTPGC